MTACNLQFVAVPCGYIVQSCRYRGPSTPRPPDPGSPARAAFARDGVASRKSSGSEILCGRAAQDDISKFMNNPA